MVATFIRKESWRQRMWGRHGLVWGQGSKAFWGDFCHPHMDELFLCVCFSQCASSLHCPSLMHVRIHIACVHAHEFPSFRCWTDLTKRSILALVDLEIPTKVSGAVVFQCKDSMSSHFRIRDALFVSFYVISIYSGLVTLWVVWVLWATYTKADMFCFCPPSTVSILVSNGCL